MIRAKLFAAVSVLTLLFAGYATADTCRSATCTQRQAVAAASVVLTPGNIAVLPVAVPLYGASYTGEGSKSDADLLAALQAILAKLDAIDARLAAQGGGAGPFKAAGGLDPIAVLTKNCQSCHSGEKPAGGYSMFDDAGSLLKPSPPERRSIEARAVKKGDMPPPSKPKLTPEEKAAVEAFVATTPAPKK